MSKNLDAVIRYRVINTCLLSKVNKYPTKEYLRQKCIEALGVNDIGIRTIEKDLYEMRNNESLGYFAPIKYDSKEGGYFYEDLTYSIDNLGVSSDDMEAILHASNILQQFKGTHFLSSLKGTIDKLYDVLNVSFHDKNQVNQSNYIQFDHQDYVPGGEFLEEFSNYIASQTQVTLGYRKFGSKESKEYTFNAYCLKEFQGLWFVLGWVEEYKSIRTFALDRIEKVSTEGLRFDRNEFDVETYFNSIYGVSEGHGKIESVELKFSSQQGNYIKALPIHRSQKVISETEDELIIQLKIIPNVELGMKILSYGANVEVLKPISFRTSIKDLLERNLRQYQ